MIIKEIAELMLRETPYPEFPNIPEIPDEVEKEIVEKLRVSLAEELTRIYSRCKICGTEKDLIVAYRKEKTLKRGNIVSLCKMCYKELGSMTEGAGNPNRDWNTGRFWHYNIPRTVGYDSQAVSSQKGEPSLTLGKKEVPISVIKQNLVREDVTYTELDGEIYRIIGHTKIDNVVLLITDKALPKTVKVGSEEVDAEKLFRKYTKKAMREWTRNNVGLEFRSCMFAGCGKSHSSSEPLERHHLKHAYTKDLSTIAVYCSHHHRQIHKTQGRSRYYIKAISELPQDFWSDVQ